MCNMNFNKATQDQERESDLGGSGGGHSKLPQFPEDSNRKQRLFDGKNIERERFCVVYVVSVLIAMD